MALELVITLILIGIGDFKVKREGKPDSGILNVFVQQVGITAKPFDWKLNAGFSQCAVFKGEIGTKVAGTVISLLLVNITENHIFPFQQKIKKPTKGADKEYISDAKKTAEAVF
jgi:hypothetical protein